MDINKINKKKLYSDKFYENHIGEKQKCQACNKYISIFNFSHHVKTQKHQYNLEKYELFKNKVEILKKADIDKKTYKILEQLI